MQFPKIKFLFPILIFPIFFLFNEKLEFTVKKFFFFFIMSNNSYSFLKISFLSLVQWKELSFFSQEIYSLISRDTTVDLQMMMRGDPEIC